MIRLKNIRIYNADSVPDHILEEIAALEVKLAIQIKFACEGNALNIILSALNRVHAAVICELVTEHGLAEAAKTEAIGLMKNIEHMSGIKIMGDDDGN